MSADMMQFDVQETLVAATDSETKKNSVKNLLNRRFTFRLWQILDFLFLMTIIITVTGIMAAKFGPASPCMLQNLWQRNQWCIRSNQRG